MMGMGGMPRPYAYCPTRSCGTARTPLQGASARRRTSRVACGWLARGQGCRLTNNQHELFWEKNDERSRRKRAKRTILGVKFTDGLEVIAKLANLQPATAAA